MDTLASGVATPKTTSILGQEGVLGRRQAMDAARALTGIPQPAFDRVSALLDQAGKGPDGAVPEGANPDTERALILKAVAARSASLGDAGSQDQALGELEWFAGAIRGQNRDSVIQQTSAIDVDDRVNSSGANPLGLHRHQRQEGRQRRVRAALHQLLRPGGGRHGARRDGPGVRADAELGRRPAERRPGLRRGGPGEAGAGAGPLLQRPEPGRGAHRGPAHPRSRRTARCPPASSTSPAPPSPASASRPARRWTRSWTRPSMRGTITKAQAEALRKDAQGGTLADAEKPDRDAALTAVRNTGDNHPTDFELQAMRGDKPRENFMLMAHALRDLASGVTHTDYWDFSAGKSLDTPMMDKVESALASGIDLPVRLSTPGQDGGHFNHVHRRAEPGRPARVPRLGPVVRPHQPGSRNPTSPTPRATGPAASSTSSGSR